VNKDELKGFKAALDSLGHEGDYRMVDWSQAYGYLASRYKILKAEHRKAPKRRGPQVSSNIREGK
jgi:hypothetical protein